ncbi:MAG: hypothetical protein V4598_08100 [Bdellovibrionota bacterium]
MKILALLFTLTTLSAWAARPDQAFSFKDNTCVCRNDKPVSKGDCVDVCRGKNTKGADVLFADFSVSTVLANSSLKHAKNWCYKFLIGDSGFPKCVLEATDSVGKKTILTNFSFPKNNSFSADVTALEEDETYWFRLIETSSKATSIPYDVYIFDPIGVPLKISDVHQYTCLPKLNPEVKTHFYYTPRFAPSPVRPVDGFVCHDVVAYGPHDSEVIPRLENLPGATPLWNQSNFLFYDNNGDGVLDVNEHYMNKAVEFGGTTKGNVRLFGLLSGPGSKEANFEAGNFSYQQLGFLMSYWVDNVTFNSYCPGDTQYASGKAHYKAIKDTIGVATEGIYVADRSESERRDYLLIRESDLKSVWFYLKNGVATKPNETDAQFQIIYFHYPLNKVTPYVKGPNQKTYRLRSSQDVGNLTNLQSFIGATGEMISHPSHDKKIGCVPKI